MFWKFLVFENFGENEIAGLALLIMQKSRSKLAKFNTLVLKQYATLESEVGFEYKHNSPTFFQWDLCKLL